MLTSRRDRTAVGASALVCAWIWMCPYGHVVVAQSDPAVSPAPETAPIPDVLESPTDGSARLFQAKCLGCHTIGSGPLTGPDLKTSAAWREDDLRVAILRMVEKVGPLPDDEVNTLLAFLKDPAASDRLRAEQQRVALLHAATLDAGSVQTGRALFSGTRTLANGGAARGACHNVGGAGGGNLAPDLTDVHARMGEPALLSACESSNFPVMRAMYAQRPVRQQEAIHLVAYLAAAAEEENAAPSSRSTLLVRSVGGAATVLGMFSIPLLYARRNRGVRSRLVTEAIKSAHP